MEDRHLAEQLRTEKLQQVALAIRDVRSTQKDLPTLRHSCVTKLGLVSDNLRALAWPLLLGVDPESYMADWKDIPQKEHRDSHQISLDCQRSLYNYDVLTGLSPRLRDRKLVELERILNMVLQTLPDLYYNQVLSRQGFHDICTVLLLVCGEDLAFKLAHKMAQSHYRECMRADFSGVIKQMDLVYPLVGQYDPELEEKLRDISPQPAVALPFIITGFQHDISSYETATRVFDFIVAAHPSAPIYMSTAVRS